MYTINTYLYGHKVNSYIQNEPLDTSNRPITPAKYLKKVKRELLPQFEDKKIDFFVIKRDGIKIYGVSSMIIEKIVFYSTRLDAEPNE